MENDAQGFVNGIYKDMPGKGFAATPTERAGLLRDVSKRLIDASIPLERRRKIIDDLQEDFGIRLSEQGLEHFMGS